MSQLLKIDEVCERLRVSRQTIYNLVRAGHLKQIKIGRSVRFNEQAILDYLNQN